MVGCPAWRVNCGRAQLASYLQYLTSSTCWPQTLMSIRTWYYNQYNQELTSLYSNHSPFERNDFLMQICIRNHILFWYLIVLHDTDTNVLSSDC